jgi:hypothetical protein
VVLVCNVTLKNLVPYSRHFIVWNREIFLATPQYP